MRASMSVATGENRRIPHTCPSCKRQYRVVVRVDLLTMHSANCPHCGHASYFDNRRGQLAPADQRPQPSSGRSVGTPTAPKPSSRPISAPSTPQPGRSVGTSTPPTPRSATSGAPAAQKATGRPSNGRSGATVRDYRGVSGAATSQKTTPGAKFRQDVAPISPRKTTGIISWWYQFRNRLYQQYPTAGRIRWLRLSIQLGAAGLILGISAFLLLVASMHVPGLYLANETGQYLQRLSVVSPNRIVDQNGELIAELFARKTGELTYEQTPASLRDKLVFVEDEDFYSHGGVDWGSVFRAAIINVFSFGYSQGGSTLTQQLARILLDAREKTLFRKFRETALAYVLEDNLSKREIITAYMNHVYLGHGAIGFQNAAQFYFEKPVTELSFAEELALVSLPSAPEHYSPLRNPEKLKIKMDAVYERMEDEDFTVPPRSDYEQQVVSMLRGMNKSPGSSAFGERVNDAPWVAEFIRLKLKNLLGSEYQYDSGLVIHTTIDAKLQRASLRETREFIAKTAPNFPPVRMQDGKVIYDADVAEQLQREYAQVAIGPMLFGMPGPGVSSRPLLQAAAIGIDTRTGAVRFMQGGTRFSAGNQLNRTIQMRRQTGSSIKPVVYSAGIESGSITVASLLDDKPIFVSQRNQVENDKDYWLPHNYSGVYEGQISVREALMKSQNIPAIRVARATGLPRLGEQFQKFFFPSEDTFENRFRSDETVAIGSLEMSPLEMAAGFSAFGNDGVIRRPYLIERIVAGDGQEVYSYSNRDEFQLNIPAERRVLDPAAARVMVSLLTDSGKYGGTARGDLLRDP
ncbi:MAG: transglycosylase domain-containing protein [Leptospiraceae bacterium]|nr:transglycosylase domain-containing protein [Leptospiraceae bacterium]